MATFKTFFGSSTVARVGTQLDPGSITADVTLSDGNLTATKTGATMTPYSLAWSQGDIATKMYMEARFTVAMTDSAIGVGNEDPMPDDGTRWLGDGPNSIGLWINEVYHNGAVVAAFSPVRGLNDWIGIAVDKTAQTVAFRNVTQGGSWTSALSIASLGTNPLYFGCTLSLNDNTTVNFDTAFVGTPPVGYTRWDGSPISAATHYTLTADTGVIAATGNAAALKLARRLTANTGAIALAGQAAGLRAVRKLLAAKGAIVLTGQTAGLRAVRKLIAAPGAIVLTGIETALIHEAADRVLPAAKGTFVLAGQTAGLRRGFTLVAAKGTFALTGIAANLAYRHAYRITADTGVFLLTGKDANLLRVEIIHRTLYAVSGAIVLSGKEAFLTSSAPYYPVSMASLKNRTYIRPWRHLW